MRAAIRLPPLRTRASPGRAELEAALKERDERIEVLEGEIAEAARTAESAEKLRAEMDELHRRGDEERMGFELQIAGTRNVKAVRALLPDYDNDIDKLKAAEPWLFGAGPRLGAGGGHEATERGRSGKDKLDFPLRTLKRIAARIPLETCSPGWNESESAPDPLTSRFPPPS